MEPTPDPDDTARSTFLSKIIDDNQGTIRFTDTKAAFGIAVLSAMVGKVLGLYPSLLPLGNQSVVTRSALVLFSLLAVLSMVFAFRVLFPTIDPYRNVRLPKDLSPRFFISQLMDKSWLRLFFSDDRYATLAETHAEYSAAVASALPGDLLSVLAGEVLKLSFIRQLKMDRLMAFARALVAAAICFIILVIASANSRTHKSSQLGAQPIPTMQMVCEG